MSSEVWEGRVSWQVGFLQWVALKLERELEAEEHHLKVLAPKVEAEALGFSLMSSEVWEAQELEQVGFLQMA